MDYLIKAVLLKHIVKMYLYPKFPKKCNDFIMQWIVRDEYCAVCHTIDMVFI